MGWGIVCRARLALLGLREREKWGYRVSRTLPAAQAALQVPLDRDRTPPRQLQQAWKMSQAAGGHLGSVLEGALVPRLGPRAVRNQRKVSRRQPQEASWGLLAEMGRSRVARRRARLAPLKPLPQGDQRKAVPRLSLQALLVVPAVAVLCSLMFQTEWEAQLDPPAQGNRQKAVPRRSLRAFLVVPAVEGPCSLMFQTEREARPDPPAQGDWRKAVLRRSLRAFLVVPAVAVLCSLMFQTV
jgi:hypothetical protein